MTKMDVIDEAQRKELVKINFGRDMATISISSVTGNGIRELLDMLWNFLTKV
jgi:translation initiation factor IF-2